MSVAGGLPLAIARAQMHRCEALQIFTKNASQWRARPLPASEIAAFREAAADTGIAPIVAHASYLINIATTEPGVARAVDRRAWRRSRSRRSARAAGRGAASGRAAGDAGDEALALVVERSGQVLKAAARAARR